MAKEFGSMARQGAADFSRLLNQTFRGSSTNQNYGIASWSDIQGRDSFWGICFDHNGRPGRRAVWLDTDDSDGNISGRDNEIIAYNHDNLYLYCVSIYHSWAKSGLPKPVLWILEMDHKGKVKKSYRFEQ